MTEVIKPDTAIIQLPESHPLKLLRIISFIFPPQIFCVELLTLRKIPELFSNSKEVGNYYMCEIKVLNFAQRLPANYNNSTNFINTPYCSENII